MPCITRRKVIQMSGGTLAVAATLPYTSILAESKDSLGWDTFLKSCENLSGAQFEEERTTNQDEYTKKIEDLLVRLNLEDDKIVEFIESYNNYNSSFPKFEPYIEKQSFRFLC